MICTEEEKTCFLERIRHLEVEKKYAYARMEEYKELIERFRWRFDKPEESGEYIATIREVTPASKTLYHGKGVPTVKLLYYIKTQDDWYDELYMEPRTVDAWMPLPEPWVEDEEEEG